MQSKIRFDSKIPVSSNMQIPIEKITNIKNNEIWKYANLEFLKNRDFTNRHLSQSFPLGDDLDFIESIQQYPNRIVYFNGIFQETISAIHSYYAQDIQFQINTQTDAITDIENTNNECDHFFASLNLNYNEQQLTVNIKKNANIDEPIYILHYFCHNESVDGNFYPNISIQANNGSNIKIVEKYYAHSKSNPYFVDTIMKISVKENAQIEHYKMQDEHHQSTHIAQSVVMLDKNSHYQNYNISMGGHFNKNNIFIKMQEELAKLSIHGIFIAQNDNYIDTHIDVSHLAPKCTSNIIYRGLANDTSTGILNAKVTIPEEANDSISHQESKNILLSEDSKIYTKPELFIYTNEVECSHGATTGQINPEEYFYLMSRGISYEAARKMLINSFLNKVSRSIGIATIREYVENIIKKTI